MTDKLQVTTEPQDHQVATPLDRAELLKSIVDQVRDNSVQGSDEYLDETTVPHGGE